MAHNVYEERLKELEPLIQRAEKVLCSRALAVFPNDTDIVTAAQNFARLIEERDDALAMIKLNNEVIKEKAELF